MGTPQFGTFTGASTLPPSTMNSRSSILLSFLLLQYAAPTEATFWSDRPTYWWRLNYTSVDACSLTPYCSIEAKLWQLMPSFAGAFHFSFIPSNSSQANWPVYLNDSLASYKQPPSPTHLSPHTPPSPVKVTLYYESLCPDCKNIFKYQIFPAYAKLASTQILDLQLVPYGNAKVFRYGEKFVFNCQHGAAECLGNKIETCAVKYTPEKALIPFVYCLEYYGPTVSNGQYCSNVHQLSWKPINNCINGPEGDELMFKMAEKTQALSPPHTFVPWFTVNGVHNEEIQQGLESDMLAFVCKMYAGAKPKECM